MTAAVILNIVFAVFVVGGIVGLLGHAILADNRVVQFKHARAAVRVRLEAGATEAGREALAARR